ncbi:MAG TPA: helix-turn-helix domain-containing protein [Phenylobacterium sp.]
MQWEELEDQACSVARTVSVIGDRWTIMILRDCFQRVRRFDDFHARLGIGRPILSDRLNKLVDAFVLTKVAYQTKPTRYEYRLTQKGLDLYPMMLAIAHWGDVHMSGKKGRPLLHHHVTCDHQFDPVTVCSECGEEVNPREVRNTLGPGARHSQHMPMELAPGLRNKAGRGKTPERDAAPRAKGGKAKRSKEPAAA